MMSSVQLQKINEDVRSFVEMANQGQRGLRIVPLGVAFEVARRSLSVTEGEAFSVRRFRALSDVSDFVSLAQKNKVTTLSANNADLLPVAHPASERKHRMSQLGVLRAQARWFADDARVADSSVSSLLATLFTESSDTPEYAYAAARLSAMTAGGITLSALVAVALGFNDGANGGYWRQQIRDLKGQWAKMFGFASFKVRKADGKVYNQYGRIVSTDVRNNKARLLTPDGRIVEAGTDALSREVKALLPSAETPDGVSAKPVRSSSEDVVIDEQDLAVLSSPGGFNSADDSSALPGGMDSANVEEIWEEADGNFQVVKGNFRDGEGSEFVVSRLEQGRVVPIGAGKDWADVQRVISEDEPNFRDGKDAVANLPEGLDLSPSGDAPDADEQVAKLPDGPYKVDRGSYEPRGAGAGVESEDYTDDPADLAVQFMPEQIGDALKEAVDDGTGVGRLEFGDDKGTEDVPAEALYNALKAQGVDADQFLDDVEAGKDVKATLPRGADIPGLDAPRNRKYEDAKAIRGLFGDKLPALLQGLSDRELQALIEQDYDFRSLVDANRDRDVPEGFYPLNDSSYSPLDPIPGAPDDLTPFQLALEFTPEQLENQLREAITPDAERSGYGKFDMPDSDGESQSFDVPAEAITDALKLHAIDTDELLDEIYGGGEMTPNEVNETSEAEELDENKVGTDYKGQHQAPSRDDDVSSSLDKIDEIFPSDVLDPKVQAQLYSSGFPEADKESFDVINKINGNPDAEVTIYRAVPNNVEDINDGDWVTLSPAYAQQHLESNLNGEGNIISKKVKASEVFTDANSINEWGYSPDKVEEESGFSGLSLEQKEKLIAATKEGGYTVSFVTGEVPTDGYMVASEADVPDGEGGFRKREEVISREDFDAEPLKYLDEFTSRNIDKLKEDGYYIGTWTSTVTDEETGEEKEYVFFDVSERIEDKEEALQAARDRNEIAIFGIEEFEEFFTDPEREAQKNAGQEAPEGDDEGSEQLPRNDGAGTPGVVEGDQPSDSGESEQEEVASRPFGEEIVELDVSGDLEAQINDAIGNKRELVFAYEGSGDAPTDRLVRPVRLETNKRTGSVSLLATDDEGNFKKFTLSKMENASDAQAARGDVISEDSTGDEIETDDAALPNVDDVNAARSAVLQKISRADGDVSTNDVEDLGEQSGVDDNVTTGIVEAVDARGGEDDETPLSDDDIARAVADVVKDVVDAKDAKVPSLDELLDSLDNKDNFDPDLIWQGVINNFEGKVLVNGHIVVSSVMHGDRRYDVVVRRAEDNTFHIYHRVVYPDKTTKVHEMGGMGWHSTKALFDKIKNQISNSIFRPATTVNKNLKPENDRTLKAAIIRPRVGDAYVTANGSLVSDGDSVVVVRRNHSKFGQRAEILYTETRFNSKNYTYTDYLRVRYEDGERNWIRSQSVDPAEAVEAESRSALERATEELNAKQAEGLPDGIFESAAPTIDGMGAVVSDLEKLLEFLPNSPGGFGDNDIPDVSVQFTTDSLTGLAENIKNKLEGLTLGFGPLRRRPKGRRRPEVEVLEIAQNLSETFVSGGLNLKQAAERSDESRKDFYVQAGDLLIATGDNLQGQIDDTIQQLTAEWNAELAKPLPEGDVPTVDNVDSDSVEGAVNAILAKLPQGDPFANYQGMAANVAGIPAYQMFGAHHLEEFAEEIKKNKNDILRANLSKLESAISIFRDELATNELAQDLKSIRDAIYEAKANRPIVPFAAPGLEALDPLTIREERVASRENLFTPTDELLGWVATNIEGSSTSSTSVLSDFQEELTEFFSGEERPLAELSPRARVALQKVIAFNLKNDSGISETLAGNMFELLGKLEVEAQAYSPRRGGIGPDADVLKDLLSIDNVFRANLGEEVLDDSGAPSGWVVVTDDGGGVNDTRQLRFEATGQLLWVKKEMNSSFARAEYIGARLNNLLGIPGAPIVALYKDEGNVLFITQGGETLDLDSGVAEFDNVFSETTQMEKALSMMSVTDVLRMAILDVAISNPDRHGSNFLVGTVNQIGVGAVEGEDSESIRVIPIDHGHAGGLNGTSYLLQDVEVFLIRNNATGSRLFHGLVSQLGAERSMYFSFEIARDLLARIQEELRNNPIYSGSVSFQEALSGVADRLNDFLGLDISIFEDMERAGMRVL